MGWNDYIGKFVTIVTRNCFNCESLKLQGCIVGIQKFEDGFYILLKDKLGEGKYIKTDSILYFAEGDL